jgi:hypothetical protein
VKRRRAAARPTARRRFADHFGAAEHAGIDVARPAR